jgi:hypothetical protein
MKLIGTHMKQENNIRSDGSSAVSKVPKASPVAFEIASINPK